MKKFVNDTAAVVRDALLAQARRPGVALLAEEDVLIRTDRPAGQVAVVSGGGSGHEPAHAGYVGVGMLTAAVAGAVFTSPSVDAVLAALRALASPAGILLIVKNYTGDRLNFGMAAELLRSEGTPVEVVTVADDVAIAASGDRPGRRGIAGTVFVHKIAGAVAEAGGSLAEVAEAARGAAADVRTMGVALNACTLPGASDPVRELGATELEWGMGIHGEAGIERGEIVPAEKVVDRLLSTIVADLDSGPGRFALLVNSLGATPPLELDIVAQAALDWLTERGHTVERVWSGPLLTALDTAGVSLSLLPVDEDRLARLDAPTQAPGWPGSAGVITPVDLVPGTSSEHGEPDETLGADSAARRALEAVCTALIDAEPALTELDSQVGDGDLGTSLARGVRAIRAELDFLPAAPDALLARVSAIIRRAIGGTSGPLYAVGLLRAGNTLGEGADWAAAFPAGVAAIGDLGGARLGDSTMLDALIPAAEAYADTDGDPAARLAAAVAAAEAGTRSTADTTARLGRASYLGERARGIEDPGARAVVIWLTALRDALATA